MGILNNLFGEKTGTQEAVKINWIALTKEHQLENVSKTAVLFKHSTRCGISSSVLKRFEKQVQMFDGAVDFYYLDLLNYRNISGSIAEKFQVLHQSPQVVVLKNGQLVAHASHYDILEIDIKQFVEDV